MKKSLLFGLSIFALTCTATAQAYIPNSGFETWGSSVGEDQQPQGWISYNIFTTALVDPTNQNPTSVTQAGAPDNYQGNYSAKITTVDLVVNPGAPDVPNRAGILMTGNVILVSPYLNSGYASQQRPASLSYYAKYTPVGNDSAYCLVAVTKWNGTSRDTLALGFNTINSALSSYTQQTVGLNYNPTFANVQPDSIAILFSSSSLFMPMVGSALWVDAVAFSGYVGMDENTTGNKVDVYPSPSSNITYFDVTSNDAKEVVVYDMTGREVIRENFENKGAKVDSWKLAAGVYTYTILDGEKKIMNRGKFSVAR